MIVRLSIVLAFGLFALNIGDVFGLHDIANLIEKSPFLWLSLLVLVARPFNVWIVAMLAVNILMIFLLGALTDYPEFSWKTLLLGLNQIVIIFALLAFTPQRADARTFLVTVALIPIVCALLGFAYQAAGIHAAFSTEFWTGIRRFQGSLIPAFLSGFGACAIPAALTLALAGRRPLFLLVLLLDIAILLLAGGRTALVVAVLASGGILLFGSGIRFGDRLWALGAGIVAAPAIAVAFGGKIIARFFKSSDNGRDLLWSYLGKLHEKYTWTGIGFAHQFDAVPREVKVAAGSAAAHNDYLRLQVELGNIGVAATYLLMTLAVVVSAWRLGKLDVSVLTAYAAFLLLSATDNALSVPTYFPIIIVAVMGMYAYHPRPYRGEFGKLQRRDRLWRMPAEQSA